MARLSKSATLRRDQIEEVSFALGSAEEQLHLIELRVNQAHDRHGLVELMEPAVMAGATMRNAFGRARRALKEISKAEALH